MEDRMKGTPVGAGKPDTATGPSLLPTLSVHQASEEASCSLLVAPFGAQGPATQRKEPQSGWPPG